MQPIDNVRRPSRFQATLRQVKAPRRRLRQDAGMANLIFRCARTGLNVQVWLPDEKPTGQTEYADSYEAVTCPACARVHLVNKTTGKMLSDKGK
jgi:hypothetical protein